MSSELQDLIDSYMWQCVKVKGTGWRPNAIFDTVLGERDTFESLSKATPFSFAPGLHDILKCPTPPPIEFFLSLPKPKDDLWAAYPVVMTKPRRKPKNYIGSGTQTFGGYKNRIAVYDNESMPEKLRKGPLPAQIPRFVARACEDGYTTTHIGVLCWTKNPAPELGPRNRLRVVTAEVVFASIFYVMDDTKLDHLWRHFLPA
jgi:hypothetical protein